MFPTIRCRCICWYACGIEKMISLMKFGSRKHLTLPILNCMTSTTCQFSAHKSCLPHNRPHKPCEFPLCRTDSKLIFRRCTRAAAAGKPRLTDNSDLSLLCCPMLQTINLHNNHQMRNILELSNDDAAAYLPCGRSPGGIDKSWNTMKPMLCIWNKKMLWSAVNSVYDKYDSFVPSLNRRPSVLWYGHTSLMYWSQNCLSRSRNRCRQPGTGQKITTRSLNFWSPIPRVCLNK